MSAQTKYSYSTPMGAAGGIVDLAPYAIDSFINEEEAGAMKFGIGVVDGSKSGATIKKPAEGATAKDFAGITVNNRTTEYDIEGKLHVRKGVSVGVMRYGRVYGRVANGITPAYGEAVYLITTGNEAGFFTNTSEANTVAVKGRFMSGKDTTANIALIELFNQAQA